MATNFLIALATAFGSATLILLALHFFLKVFAPNAFKEVLSIPEKSVEQQAPETVYWTNDWSPALARRPTLAAGQLGQMQQTVVSTVTLSALSGTQIAESPSAGATRLSAQSGQLGRYVTSAA